MIYNVTPPEFLSELGWKYTRRGSWLVLKICPFCEGGRARDAQTFAVHAVDGNYLCHRTTCGARGTFWGLIESQGKNVKDYLGSRESQGKSKSYIYGRESKNSPAKKGKKYIYGR